MPTLDDELMEKWTIKYWRELTILNLNVSNRTELSTYDTMSSTI